MTLYKREYVNYKEYVDHQTEKLKDEKKLRRFRKRTRKSVAKFLIKFEAFSNRIHGKSVLCLGARLGEEVKAFIKLGYTGSIGIDLNPGPNNKHVIGGDFHRIPFRDNLFEAIYCNSLDHASDLREISKEVARVLRSDGVLILEIPFVKRNRRYDKRQIRRILEEEKKYESMLWDRLDDVLAEFKEFTEAFERIYLESDKTIVFLK